jgi:hypothetical protein
MTDDPNDTEGLSGLSRVAVRLLDTARRWVYRKESVVVVLFVSAGVAISHPPQDDEDMWQSHLV